MKVDANNRLIVIPQSQLRDNTRDERLGTVVPYEVPYDFPISMFPVEEANAVVVYTEDTCIFLKSNPPFNSNQLMSLEQIDEIHVMLRRISDLIRFDMSECEPLDNFNFEDIFGKRS